MSRTLLPLVVGAAMGAGITAVLVRGAPGTDLTDLPPRNPVLPSLPQSDAQATSVDGELYRRLADAGIAEIEALIARAAAAASSRDRDFTLTLLLDRYADFDAEAAVRRAHGLGVGSPAIGAVHGALGRSDPAAALASLRTVDRPSDAADVGAALVEALGNDAAALERVAAVLAERDAGAAPSGRPPVPATPAGFVPFTAERSVVQLMAERWAAIDPERALALAQTLDDERLRTAVEAAGLATLARTAPDAAFARLSAADADARQRGVVGALGELARADPEKVLALAEDFPAEPRSFAQFVAMRELAERDPLAAARYVGNLPLGAERQNLVQIVARSYGKRDATAALQWARAQPDRNLVWAVMSGMAESDPRRAFDVALSLDTPAERIRGLQATLQRASIAPDAEVAAMAERLAALDDPSLRSLSDRMLLPQWASRSPDGAMRWLLANGGAVSPEAFTQIGEQLATRDPRIATGYTVQIPAAAREPWLRGVAEGYARQDPHGAVEWLGQFRGETWHAGAAVALAMRVARDDGTAAARLLDDADPAGTHRESAMVVGQIANAWAGRDPAGAAQWALGRPTEAQRTQGLTGAIGVWAMSAPAAARAWTLQLPANALKDEALARLLRMTSFSAPAALDPVVLNAFGSEGARQRAVLEAVQGLAQIDKTRARAVAERYLTDPGLRVEADRAIDADRREGILGTRTIETTRAQ